MPTRFEMTDERTANIFVVAYISIEPSQPIKPGRVKGCFLGTVGRLGQEGSDKGVPAPLRGQKYRWGQEGGRGQRRLMPST